MHVEALRGQPENHHVLQRMSGGAACEACEGLEDASGPWRRPRLQTLSGAALDRSISSLRAD